MSLIHKKIWKRKDLDEQLRKWRNTGEKLVFTNGCFDILHSGHALYLQEAKGLGDRLILGLNSDDSVRRLKGKSRPYNDLESRAVVLAALGSVDAVIEFEEDTPRELIQEVKPDVLVKGGDYNIEDIVGGEFVKKQGGKVYSLNFVEGKSTTKLIQKILTDD